MGLDRAAAWQLLTEWTASDSLRKHALAVEAAVRGYARLAGADDALLLNGSGELCCGTTANLLVQREGCWLTPPLSSGCLPGVMRGRALQLGLAQETRLPPDVQTGDRWLLLNSLSARPLRALDDQPLEPLSAEDAEAFWRRLL